MCIRSVFLCSNVALSFSVNENVLCLLLVGFCLWPLVGGAMLVISTWGLCILSLLVRLLRFCNAVAKMASYSCDHCYYYCYNIAWHALQVQEGFKIANELCLHLLVGHQSALQQDSQQRANDLQTQFDPELAERQRLLIEELKWVALLSCMLNGFPCDFRISSTCLRRGKMFSDAVYLLKKNSNFLAAVAGWCTCGFRPQFQCQRWHVRNVSVVLWFTVCNDYCCFFCLLLCLLLISDLGSTSTLTSWMPWGETSCLCISMHAWVVFLTPDHSGIRLDGMMIMLCM